MEFIMENYLWIILAVIIILMAIVGYIADKTGFIKKTEKQDKTEKNGKEKKKKGKNKTVEEPVIIENKGIDELLKDANKKSKKTSNIIQSNEVVDVNSPIDQTLENNVQPLNEDLTAPLVNEPVVENNDVVDQSLFAPLEPNDNLKQVEEVGQTTNEVSDDEDIWKF